MLEIGVCAWSMQSTYMRPRPFAALYREALNDARHAESLGFDSFWLGEHHFSYDGYCPSLAQAAAFIAAGTERIAVGPGVLLLPLHGAARVAEACAATNAFAAGRLRMAVAVGWRDVEFNGLGVKLADRAQLMNEHCESLVNGACAKRFAGTEFWMGGISKPALRRAGRYGASPLLTFAGPNEIRAMSAQWRSELPAKMAKTPRVGLIVDFWTDNSEARRAWIRLRMREQWRYYAKLFSPGPDVPIDAVLDGMMAPTVLGTPSEAIAALQPLIEAGVEVLVLRPRFDGIEGKEVRRCMDLIASDVMPELRRHR